MGTLTFTLDTTAATPESVALSSGCRLAAVTGSPQTVCSSAGIESGATIAVLDRWRDVDKAASVRGRRVRTRWCVRRTWQGTRGSVGTLTFTLDTTAATPGGSALGDTGTSSSDRITSEHCSLRGIESGRDGAVLDRWRDDVDKPSGAAEGSHGEGARRTDVAGHSSVGTLTFTLDRQRRRRGVALERHEARAAVTGSPRAVCFLADGIESGATVQYSTDGGTTWTNGFSADQGRTR